MIYNFLLISIISFSIGITVAHVIKENTHENKWNADSKLSNVIEFRRNITEDNVNKIKLKQIHHRHIIFEDFRQLQVDTSNDSDSDNKREDCAENSSDDFPEDLFSMEAKRHGAVIIHFIAGVYCFTLLAVVCNNYFLPSVELICENLNLSQDVAAATFMSIATSAPEFFVNVIGTFVTKSDIGVGTIVGSAMFNTLGVAGLGGLAAKTYIQLEWWPITRDSLIYLFNILLLLTICSDNMIQWYETVVLLVCYIAYFLVMWQNRRIYNLIMKLVAKIRRKHKREFTNNVQQNSDVTCDIQQKCNDDETKDRIDVDDDEDDDEEEELSLWHWPSNDKRMVKVWWVYSWPIRFILTFTIPSTKRFPKLYLFTFVMCIVWIGVNSYMVSWMMTTIGATIQIPDFIMGMTFLAAGGCLPESFSIFFVSRKGDGGIGVSNALGANTLDILLCLGLPWFIRAMVNIAYGVDPSLAITSGSLVYTVTALIIAVLTLYLTVSLNHYRLNTRTGIILVTCLVVFLTLATVLQLYVFYDPSVMPCDNNE